MDVCFHLLEGELDAPFPRSLTFSPCRVSLPSLFAHSQPLSPILLLAASSFWSTSTEYSADSVEFSPHHPSLLAVGTYQIETPAPLPPPPPPKIDTGEDSSDEEEVIITLPAKRKGRCLIYDVQGEVV